MYPFFKQRHAMRSYSDLKKKYIQVLQLEKINKDCVIRVLPLAWNNNFNAVLNKRWTYILKQLY